MNRLSKKERKRERDRQNAHNQIKREMAAERRAFIKSEKLKRDLLTRDLQEMVDEIKTGLEE